MFRHRFRNLNMKALAGMQKPTIKLLLVTAPFHFTDFIAQTHKLISLRIALPKEITLSAL